MRNEGWLWRLLITVPEMEAAVDDGCPMSEDKSDVDGETVLGVISVPVIDTSKAHPQKKRQKQEEAESPLMKAYLFMYPIRMICCKGCIDFWRETEHLECFIHQTMEILVKRFREQSHL